MDGGLLPALLSNYFLRVIDRISGFLTSVGREMAIERGVETSCTKRNGQIGEWTPTRGAGNRGRQRADVAGPLSSRWGSAGGDGRCDDESSPYAVPRSGA